MIKLCVYLSYTITLRLYQVQRIKLQDFGTLKNQLVFTFLKDLLKEFQRHHYLLIVQIWQQLQNMDQSNSKKLQFSKGVHEVHQDKKEEYIQCLKVFGRQSQISAKNCILWDAVIEQDGKSLTEQFGQKKADMKKGCNFYIYVFWISIYQINNFKFRSIMYHILLIYI
ncbi:unnamed protein product [Paramecium pentaurelia]|uniref:Uncharacterized protein n=1 Tax=Paramecium pentaurelia TaxID=43138 RepID=A0A8S1XUW3_9CILI|nr:unnamed protein product [Paramecium pentaurelia]